jgi:hypothetical protein
MPRPHPGRPPTRAARSPDRRQLSRPDDDARPSGAPRPFRRSPAHSDYWGMGQGRGMWVLIVPLVHT